MKETEKESSGGAYLFSMLALPLIYASNGFCAATIYKWTIVAMFSVPPITAPQFVALSCMASIFRRMDGTKVNPERIRGMTIAAFLIPWWALLVSWAALKFF